MLQINEELSLACYSPQSLTGKLIAGALRKRQIMPKKSFEFDETEAMLTLVCEGDHWSVTTPLCLMQVAHLANKLTICPLPGPTDTRTLTLIARQYELGTLPARMSQSAREILRKQYLPHIKKMLPWAIKDIQA